jgi:hypothetical protein
VDTRVWHQVGLKFVQIDIERTIKAQTGGDGADDLSNETIEMLIIWTGNVQAATADIVHSFVIDEECTVGVLNGTVGRQNGVVRLNDRGRNARSGVNGEFELALLSVVGGEALKEKSAKPRTRTTTERVEDEETLEGRAIVCTSLVQDSVLHSGFLPATRRMRSITPSTISLPMV